MVNCDLKGKNILLIDDIHTSGATIDECYKELKKANCNFELVQTYLYQKSQQYLMILPHTHQHQKSRNYSTLCFYYPFYYAKISLFFSFYLHNEFYFVIDEFVF